MNTFIQFGSAPSKGSGGFFIFLGIALILFGALIIAMPELLALLVAALIISSGLSILLFGLKLKSFSRSDSQVEILDRFDM